MELNIKKNDSGELMLAKIKSYLLYPEKENRELREQAEFSFFLDEVEYDFRAIKKTNPIDSYCLKYLNDCPPITYFDDRFYNRKHQMFTAGILMRLIISGEIYRPKKMSLTLAAKIFSGKYGQDLDTGEMKKKPHYQLKCHQKPLERNGRGSTSMCRLVLLQAQTRPGGH